MCEGVLSYMTLTKWKIYVWISKVWLSSQWASKARQTSSYSLNKETETKCSFEMKKCQEKHPFRVNKENVCCSNAIWRVRWHSTSQTCFSIYCITFAQLNTNTNPLMCWNECMYSQHCLNETYLQVGKHTFHNPILHMNYP